MTDVKQKSTRRAFFLNGGAVLGAGVAASAGAAALAAPVPVPAPAAAAGARAGAEDREAIRQLHVALVAQLENQSAEAPANLFGEPGQVQLGAYREAPSKRADEVKFSEDGLRATSTFHCEVELCTPLPEDCTAAQMARLQGLMATRRWESGRFDASYVKTRGQWTMASVSYTAL